MKKTLALAMVVVFGLSFSTPLFALPEPVLKLKSGLTDIVRSPLEIGHFTKDEIKSSRIKPMGLVGGLVKGSGHMIKKAVSGAVDIATFPLK